MGNEPQATPHPAGMLRASDADREQVAAVLQTAFAEGRLTMTELDERLAVVYAARTYAELAPVTSDLPHPGFAPAAPAPAAPGSSLPGPAAPGDVAVLSSFTRRGPWVVGREFRAVAVLGTGKIDLRTAHFADGETTIQVFSLLSTVHIVVPENAEVHVTGVGVLGEFDHRWPDATPVPGAPRITITGCTVLGNVEIRRRGSTDQWLRDKIQERLERRQLRMERRLTRRGF